MLRSISATDNIPGAEEFRLRKIQEIKREKVTEKAKHQKSVVGAEISTILS